MKLNKIEREAVIRRIKAEIRKANKEAFQAALDAWEPTEEWKQLEEDFQKAIEICRKIYTAARKVGVYPSSTITYMGEFKSLDKVDNINYIKVADKYKEIPLPSNETLEDEIILSGCADAQIMIQELLKKYLNG